MHDVAADLEPPAPPRGIRPLMLAAAAAGLVLAVAVAVVVIAASR